MFSSLTNIAIVVLILFLVFFLFKKLFKLVLFVVLVFGCYLLYLFLTGGNPQRVIKDTKAKASTVISGH